MIQKIRFASPKYLIIFVVYIGDTKKRKVKKKKKNDKIGSNSVKKEKFTKKIKK